MSLCAQFQRPGPQPLGFQSAWATKGKACCVAVPVPAGALAMWNTAVLGRITKRRELGMITSVDRVFAFQGGRCEGSALLGFLSRRIL